MAIDTDDLSRKTYKAILAEAEKFNDNLMLRFGLLSYRCADEKDYIRQSALLIQEMFGYDEAEIDDLFFGEPPTRESFYKVLNKILKNISAL